MTVFKASVYDLFEQTDLLRTSQRCFDLTVYLAGESAASQKRVVVYSEDNREIAISFRAARVDIAETELRPICGGLLAIRADLVERVRALASGW